MTIARSNFFRSGVEGVFHCVSRCVRRAYLCGNDAATGKNFSHRKQWIRTRLKELAGIFFIDICGYAVMENHMHVVVRTRPDLESAADDRDVARRWWRLFPKRHTRGPHPVSEEEVEALCGDTTRILELRARLASVSWIMRCLKEPIARRANDEDDVTGRFWEGRFKCTALEDQAAVLTCSAYVDLNPIRAGAAETPETSTHTSVYDRIVAYQTRALYKNAATTSQRDGRPPTPVDAWLCPLMDTPNRRGFLGIGLEEYLELLDWTGRQIVQGKHGAVPAHLSPILGRLEIERTQWLRGCTRFGSLFYLVAGKATSIRKAAKAWGKHWFKGIGSATTLFQSASND